MATVYDDDFYNGYADAESRMKLKEKMILAYEHNLFKNVLEKIANCSDSSELIGIKMLAKMTLDCKNKSATCLLDTSN